MLYDKEYVIEFKVFENGLKFNKGKKQVSYYANRRGLKDGYYVIFASSRDKSRQFLKDLDEETDGVMIHTYIIWYDEEKDF